jgi:hypothetical protein
MEHEEVAEAIRHLRHDLDDRQENGHGRVRASFDPGDVAAAHADELGQFGLREAAFPARFAYGVAEYVRTPKDVL